MGHKTRHIKSTTACSVRIFGHDGAKPMTQKIHYSPSTSAIIDFTRTRPHTNVAKAVEMVEESILEFLVDRDTKMKMLYELAAKASGSCKLFPCDQGFVRRSYDGEKKWCRVLDFPYKWRKGSGYDHEKWLHHLKTLQRTDCKIEVFDDSSRTAPYVLITGAKKKDMQDVAAKISTRRGNVKIPCTTAEA